MSMSQTQYAQHAGVSQQAISKAVRAGKIPVLVDGRIDAAVADATWRALRMAPVDGDPAIVDLPEPPADPRPSAPPAAEDDSEALPLRQPDLEFQAPRKGTAASEQMLLSRARREKLELDMAARRGELAPIREIETAISAMVIAARNRLLLVPNNIADATIRAQVDRLIREALADVGNWQMAVEENSAA